MTHSSGGGHHFNKHRSANPLHRLILNRYRHAVRRLLEPAAGELILDVGCGEGDLLRWLCEHTDASFLGCEFSAGMCSELSAVRNDHPGRVLAVCADGLRLPFEAKRFEKVTCWQTLEHVQSPEEFLDSLVRVCRGTLCLSVPREPLWRMLNVCRGCYLSAFGNTPGHINHWSAQTFYRFISTRLDEVIIDTSAPPFLVARGHCRG